MLGKDHIEMREKLTLTQANTLIEHIKKIEPNVPIERIPLGKNGRYGLLIHPDDPFQMVMIYDIPGWEHYRKYSRK